MTTARSPRRLVAMLLAALALQLLLGMWVNLWVVIPSAHPGAAANSYFAGLLPATAWALDSGATMLRLHVALGIILFLGGLLALVRAVRSGDTAWVWATAIGFVAILGAAFNGLSFVNYNHNFSSYLMTVGFVIASLSYVAGMLASR
jgi:hypothetical protein